MYNNKLYALENYNFKIMIRKFKKDDIYIFYSYNQNILVKISLRIYFTISMLYNDKC